MKNVLRLYFLLLFSVTCITPKTQAQSFAVDTIIMNGDPNTYINMVFLGDGFQAVDSAAFITTVTDFSNYLFGISPFAEYKNYFNVFAIWTPSADAGTDHPGTATDVAEPVFPVSAVNTYFNSAFDQYNIHRLLVPVNTAAINSVLLTNFPLYNQALMLVNSPEYGGSGGTFATASLNVFSYEIMVHELGHSFGDLSDEYYAGDQYANETVNMTQETDSTLVKWKNWIGVSGVGIHQHCCGGSSAAWYKPNTGCKMEFLGVAFDFCPVCREALVKKIHSVFGSPIVHHSPAQGNIVHCSDTLSFHLYIEKPEPNTMQVTWKLNGNVVATGMDTLLLPQTQLDTANNVLTVEVVDTTTYIRDSAYTINNTYSLAWIIDSAATISISPNSALQFCEGDSVILTAPHAENYLWSTGETSQQIIVNSSENVFVTTTDINGCDYYSDTITTTMYNLPDIPVITANGNVLTSSSPTGNQWYLTGSPLFGAMADTIAVQFNGDYTVTVTNANGCTAPSLPFQYPPLDGISHSSALGITLLPNPSLGVVDIQEQHLPISRVVIYTTAGNVVYQSSNVSFPIDLTSQPDGTYVIELTVGGETIQLKWVKQGK